MYKKLICRKPVATTVLAPTRALIASGGAVAEELRLSHQLGLNLYVINGIAPDIPLKTILKGSMP